MSIKKEVDWLLSRVEQLRNHLLALGDSRLQRLVAIHASLSRPLFIFQEMESLVERVAAAVENNQPAGFDEAYWISMHDSGSSMVQSAAYLIAHWLALEDICGYDEKFSPGPRHYSHNTLALAEQIYQDRDGSLMPYLGDSLLDDGCDEVLIDHCRNRRQCPCHLNLGSTDEKGFCFYCGGSGWVHQRHQHCRGCWVLDEILGKRPLRSTSRGASPTEAACNVT